MKTIEELLAETNSLEPTETITTTEPTVSKAQTVEDYSSSVVIELLKKSLNIHWQQTISLTAQAMHLDRWGYTKLSAILKEDAEEEHQHAMENIKRLEFFDEDYQPIVVSPPSWTRHDMVAIIQYNLNSVREAAAAEKQAITASRLVGDELTANSMIPLLQGSENGIRLYEGYLKMIDQMGLDNFLSLYA